MIVNGEWSMVNGQWCPDSYREVNGEEPVLSVNVLVLKK